MWTCPQCGERIEEQFDSCWKCAARVERVKPSAKPGPRWSRFLLLGFYFEVLLFVATVALRDDSWLSVQLRNFALISHYPVLTVLDFMETDSVVLGILGLLFSEGLMVLAWAWLFRSLAILISRASVRLGLSRRQKVMIGIALGGLCLVAAAPAILDRMNDRPKPFASSAGLQSVVQGNNALALDLYRQLAAQQGEGRNLFFSPLSAAVALGMTFAGARGQTELEMAALLRTHPGDTNLHAAFGELTARLDTLHRWRRITLATANSLWCQQGDPFTDAFLDLTRTRYQATVRQVDFRRDAKSAAAAINQWIARSTKGNIKEMVSGPDLSENVSLILCNAIYFHGQWASPFKRGATQPSPFRVTNDRQVNVPMMSQKGRFRAAHVQADDFMATLLEMPYFGRDLSMVVLLPYEVEGLVELERRLTAETLRAWLAELDRGSPHETTIRFPRFTTSSQLDLVPALKALGMASAFDNAAANFSGMDGRNNLYLSSALQHAFVEVNEEGTKATAVTSFKARTRSMANYFNADHPFVFLIRENATGSILFLGRVVDPTR